MAHASVWAGDIRFKVGVDVYGPLNLVQNLFEVGIYVCIRKGVCNY